MKPSSPQPPDKKESKALSLDSLAPKYSQIITQPSNSQPLPSSSRPLSTEGLSQKRSVLINRSVPATITTRAVNLGKPIVPENIAPEYHVKGTCTKVTIIETKWDSLTPTHIINKLASPGGAWIPNNCSINKTKVFFQMILIDTESVEIIPEVSPRDPSIITHSKLKIMKVLSLEDWNQHATTEKRFSIIF